MLGRDSRPRIAFITAHDPTSRRSWSGIPYYVFRALQREIGPVVHVGNWQPRGTILRGKVMSILSRKCFGRPYDYTHGTRLAKEYGRHLTKILKSDPYDFVFACSASTQVAYLDTDLPILYFADTTYSRMINYYPQFTKLWPRNIRDGMEIESLGIHKSAALLYASKWAADSAIQDYGAEKKCTHVIPMGANIPNNPPLMDCSDFDPQSPFHLLFLGVDWERKGGPIAWEAFQCLREQGFNIRMTICGCVPPSRIRDPNLQIIRFLDKNRPEDQSAFNELLSSSNLLLLPTKAECFGVVFCEASAYGIPSLSTRTGGVESAVHEGINGYLFASTAGGDSYAQKVAELICSKEQYTKLRKTSRDLYESTLNWNAWAKRVKDICSTLQ